MGEMFNYLLFTTNKTIGKIILSQWLFMNTFLKKVTRFHFYYRTKNVFANEIYLVSSVYELLKIDKKIWYVQGLLLNLNHGFPNEQSCITKSCMSLNHANTVTYVGIDLHIQFFTIFSLKIKYQIQVLSF